MTTIATPAKCDVEPKPPLRVGMLIRQSFTGLLSGFALLAGTAVALVAVEGVASILMVHGTADAGFDYMFRQSLKAGGSPSAGDLAVSVAGVVLSILSENFIHIVLLQLALKQQSGTREGLAGALRTGVRFLLPMSGAYVAIWLLVILGFCALLVPGIWLVGVYAVVTVVIVAEERTRGFLGRTQALTEGYRWPLAGFVLLVNVIAFAPALLAMGLANRVESVLGAGTATTMLTLAVNSMARGLLGAFAAVAFVQAYHRLREIKEGGRGPAAVFT